MSQNSYKMKQATHYANRFKQKTYISGLLPPCNLLGNFSNWSWIKGITLRVIEDGKGFVARPQIFITTLRGQAMSPTQLDQLLMLEELVVRCGQWLSTGGGLLRYISLRNIFLTRQVLFVLFRISGTTLARRSPFHCFVLLSIAPSGIRLGGKLTETLSQVTS